MTQAVASLGGRHEKCHTCGCQGHPCCCQSTIQMIPEAHDENCGNKVWDELADPEYGLLPALSDPNWQSRRWWEFWR